MVRQAKRFQMKINEKAKRDLRIAAAMLLSNQPGGINVMQNVTIEIGGGRYTKDASRAVGAYVNRIMNRANPDRRMA